MALQWPIEVYCNAIGGFLKVLKFLGLQRKLLKQSWPKLLKKPPNFKAIIMIRNVRLDLCFKNILKCTTFDLLDL